MYKLFAFWSAPKPEDREVFEEYYAATHVSPAPAVSHVEKITTTLRPATGSRVSAPGWAIMRAFLGDVIARFGATVPMGDEVVGHRRLGVSR